jgi:hypothetical protein
VSDYFFKLKSNDVIFWIFFTFYIIFLLTAFEPHFEAATPILVNDVSILKMWKFCPFYTQDFSQFNKLLMANVIKNTLIDRKIDRSQKYSFQK